jgi:nucleoside phosphorylase
LDLHEQQCFCSGFFALWYVKVHFVAVKVSVVGRTNTKMHTECLVRQHTNIVRHDGHAVKRRLPVEYGYVAVLEVTLNNEAKLYSFSDFSAVNNEFKTYAFAVGANNVECPWIVFRTINNQLLKLFNVPGSYFFRH